MGSTNIPPEDVLLPNQLSNVELANHRSDLWRSNYHEASIYIEEGLNNDKFENHPRKRASKLVQQAGATPSVAAASGVLVGRQQPIATATPNVNLLAPTSAATTEHQHQQLTPQLQFQPSPLIACAQGDKTTLLGTKEFSNNNNTNDNLHGDHDHQKRHTDDKASGTFLLGGQYTTIETYILVHNRYFYQLDLIASIILLLLALVEPPAVDGYELSPSTHAAIEMFALGIIAIELLLKFRWMGPRRFFSHGRTVSKLFVLVAMNLETIIILLRHSIHARYTRALRPIFLLDNHYCHGLRRAVRQIFQSLPPIIDMFTLALFFMFVFSIFGFYMFASNNYYFSDMPKTVGNLLVLATTANLPDIMMPSYAVSRWSAVYFVLFIIIHLFLFTNLTMAAVYEIFTRKEKEKFHKLLLHRRKACQKAFKLLVSRRQPNKIQYRQFMGLMRYLNQKCSMFDAYLIFKALDTDKSGSLSLEEFYQIYDFINLKWKLIYPRFEWYDDYDWIPIPIKSFLAMSARVIKHRFFEWSIDLLIVILALLQFVEASAFELPIPGLKLPLINSNTANFITVTSTNITSTNLVNADPSQQLNSTATTSLIEEDDLYVKPDKVSTIVFIGIFTFETIIRVLALGWTEYWHLRWNRFDLFVLVISIVGSVNGAVGGHPFGWVLVLRTIRLMRTFEFKRRYKDMWQTLTYILLKRFVSMTCVVMILYYFFGIIGMELLGDYDLRNCCKNTSLESQFKYDNSTEGAKYYLNDFGDIIASYLTLFSMTSNTYWLATMEAYAIVSQTNWVRLFFGLYYLGSIIVMNIVIAFILESFLFHIHYRNKMGNSGDDTNLFTVSVTLSSFEVDFLRENLTSKRDTRKLNQIVSKLRSKHVQECDRQHDDNGYCRGGNQYKGRDLDDDGETISLLQNNNHKRATRYTLKRNQEEHQQQPSNTRQGGDHVGSPAESVATPTKPNNGATNNKRKKLLSSSSSTNSMGSVGSGGNSAAAGAAAGMKRKSVIGIQKSHHGSGDDLESETHCHRPEWYLIYQAEQIRNKFSFTMKMYADEVGGWLAEAEQADQDEMSRMISRNQIRAEHVAMARLARRNLAEMQHQMGAAFDDGHLLEWSRPRSWSTSEGGANARGGHNTAEYQRDQGDTNPTTTKGNRRPNK
uniref:Two pore calcium channel protein 1 n=1 Tax=Aceria tosichella TaxID=561515 RepID=A0A6G1S7J6_9ACAR